MISPLPYVNKQYKIGRNDDNDIKIKRPEISGNHCTITIVSENVIVLEDNQSTNGTFVNGVRIKRSLITPHDEVMLAKLKVKFDKIFEKQVAQQIAPKPAENQVPTANYSEEFEQLKTVYETYRAAKVAAMGSGTLKQKGIQAALSFIPFVGSALGILASSTVNPQEKLFALSEEFKINYICPKCKRFLGDLPWQNLANQKKCVACKAVWVKEI
jgi:pSer/pThr/pTyr-binding forkhead associated (FHA) protein